MKGKTLRHFQRITEGYMMRDLEGCLGEDHRKLEKYQPLAPRRVAGYAAARRERSWHHLSVRRISLPSIRQHPQEINLGKADQTWSLNLVLLKKSSCLAWA